MIVALAAVMLVWLVGCGWLVVLHLRSRMALPDEPAPTPTR